MGVNPREVPTGADACGLSYERGTWRQNTHTARQRRHYHLKRPQAVGTEGAHTLLRITASTDATSGV